MEQHRGYESYRTLFQQGQIKPGDIIKISHLSLVGGLTDCTRYLAKDAETLKPSTEIRLELKARRQLHGLVWFLDKPIKNKK